MLSDRVWPLFFLLHSPFHFEQMTAFSNTQLPPLPFSEVDVVAQTHNVLRLSE
jgi:hypothetical protein